MGNLYHKLNINRLTGNSFTNHDYGGRKEMSVKKIAVIGAGNGGHAMAAHKSLDGFEVSLFELPRFAANIRQVLDMGW